MCLFLMHLGLIFRHNVSYPHLKPMGIRKRLQKISSKENFQSCKNDAFELKRIEVLLWKQT